MKAGTIVRTSRVREGLTQRELAKRSHVPQSMISSIECGHQDPRFSTLERILAVVGRELELVETGGKGVDRTQFIETLRLTPEERLRRGVQASIAFDRLARRARRRKKS